MDRPLGLESPKGFVTAVLLGVVSLLVSFLRKLYIARSRIIRLKNQGLV